MIRGSQIYVERIEIPNYSTFAVDRWHRFVFVNSRGRRDISLIREGNATTADAVRWARRNRMPILDSYGCDEANDYICAEPGCS